MEKQPEKEKQAEEAGVEYVQQLASVLHDIEALPLVTSTALIGDISDKPTNIKVRANLKSEFVEVASRRQPVVCCSKQRPTQLDAARALLAKLKSADKGGYASELAAATSAAASAMDAAGTSREPTAFDRIRPAGWPTRC